MMRNAVRAGIVLLTVAALVFSALWMIDSPLPGEDVVLSRIAALEKQPLPSTCPKPSDKEGIHVDLKWLAQLYKANQRYDDAIKHHLRAIELQKKLCGPNHVSVVGPMLSLAESFELAGESEKAAQMRKEIMEREAQLLRENPDLENTCREFYSVFERFNHTKLEIRPATFEFGESRTPGCAMELRSTRSTLKAEVKNVLSQLDPPPAGWAISNQADGPEGYVYWMTKGRIACSIQWRFEGDNIRGIMECALK